MYYQIMIGIESCCIMKLKGFNVDHNEKMVKEKH